MTEAPLNTSVDPAAHQAGASEPAATTLITPLDSTTSPQSACGAFSHSFKTSHLVKALVVILLVGICAFAVLFWWTNRDYATQKDDNGANEKKNIEMKSQLSSLKSRLADLDAEISKLTRENDEKDVAIKKLMTTYNSLLEEKKKLLNEKSELETEIKHEESEIATLESESNTKQKELEEQKAKVQNLEKEIAAKEIELEETQSARKWYWIGGGSSLGINVIGWTVLAFAHSSLSEAENNIANLTIVCNGLKDEVMRLMQEVHDKLKKADELQEKVNEQAKEIANFKSEISRLEEEKKQSNTLIEEYTKQKSNLNDQIKLKQRDIAAKEADYNAVKTKYDALMVVYTKAKAEYDELFAKYTTLTTAYNKRLEEHKHLQESYATLNTDYHALNTTHYEMLKAYDQLIVDNNDLTIKRKKLDEDMLLLEEKFTKLITDLEALKVKYFDLETKNKQLADSFKLLEETYELLKKDHKTLQDEYNLISKDYDSSNAKLYSATIDKLLLSALHSSRNVDVTKTLIYSGTEHGFKKAAFNAQVGGKGPTLTVIGTSDGYYFGIFLNSAWETTTGTHADISAFTFSVNNTESCAISDATSAYSMSDGKLFSLGKLDIVVNEQASEADAKKYTSGTLDPGKNYVIPVGFDPLKFYHDGNVMTVIRLEVYLIKVTK